MCRASPTPLTPALCGRGVCSTWATMKRAPNLRCDGNVARLILKSYAGWGGYKRRATRAGLMVQRPAKITSGRVEGGADEMYMLASVLVKEVAFVKRLRSVGVYSVLGCVCPDLACAWLVWWCSMLCVLCVLCLLHSTRWGVSRGHA